MVEVVWVDGVFGVVWVDGVVGLDGVDGVDELVGVVTLLAEHYFVQISVSWWSLLIVMGLCVSCPTTTIHESLVNRLTYGCKPVKIFEPIGYLEVLPGGS